MISCRLLLGIAIISVATGCSTEPDVTMPQTGAPADMQRRVDHLEKEAAASAVNDRHQIDGSRLTMQTIGNTNTYLSELYANINSTRAQDLPEWEDMYRAITDHQAMQDPEYGLGPRRLETNFHRLDIQTDENATSINTVSTDLEKNELLDQQQTDSLQLILQRLNTIDSNIGDLNKAVDQKFKTVDRKLAEYDGRMVGVENRMDTAEVSLESFRFDFEKYKQRVTNIENLLRKYDLAIMHASIQDLKEVTTNHDQRLTDLQGRVLNNSSEITVLRNNLYDAEQEISSNSASSGTLKVAVNEIFTRLNNCQCFERYKEL
jgi:DNA repair ATPase RecN